MTTERRGSQDFVDGAARTHPDLFSGERELLDILGVSQCRSTFPAARTTSDVPIGPTGGAEGDELVQVSLVVAPTVANLTITDGDGTVVATFLTTDPVGTTKDVRAVASGGGFKIPLHASGVGTVTCAGDFT